jgi:Xaa-Pro aminopeptidase
MAVRWFRTVVLAAALADGFAGAAALAQSPVAFPKEVYAARRKRLADQVKGAAIVVPGKYLVGAHELPKQDADFWYLTGVESPYATLVIAPDSRPDAAPGAIRTALFLPDSFQFAGAQFPHVDSAFRRAPWNIPRQRLAPGQGAVEATGIAETYRVQQFAARVGDIVGKAKVVYLPMSFDSLYAPLGMLEPRSVEQQVAKAIGDVLGARDLKDVTPLIRRMRLVKDTLEVAALRRAARISAAGMETLMRAVRPGMNDLEAAGILELDWKRHGSQRAAFAPIVGSGPNSMQFFTVMGENYDAVNRVMKPGELLFVDYGAAEFNMYGSDLCRTIPVSGTFTPEQRKYYNLVLEAQEAAIAAVKPGALMLDVIKAAARVFKKAGLDQNENPAVMGVDRVWGVMPSPTHYINRDAGITKYTRYGAGVRDIGHHVGLEATDSRDWSVPLEAGMVITVEPKIYIPDKQIAIMIEDMILVTPTGRENLSIGAPKSARDIEALMAAAAKRR